jgi:hypothetical protein
MNTIHKETQFGEMLVRPYLDGFRVEYGLMKGWEVFDTQDEMLNHLADWAVDELSVLTKRIEGIAKLQRFIKKHRRLNHVTNSRKS